MSDMSLPGAAALRGKPEPQALLSRPWVQVALAWLVFLLLRDWSWHGLGLTFHDTDDAMRLQQVRDLLNGQSWFDLVQKRLDPGFPAPSHWSRLVDLPIADAILLATPWLGQRRAEILVMLAWPPVTFLFVLIAVRLAAVRLAAAASAFAGTAGVAPAKAEAWAALPALVLAVTCLKATWQFFPGRIDHHNVQMALTMALFAALARPGRVRSAAFAGVFAGAMLAVGFETLPFVAIAAGCYGLRFVLDEKSGSEAACFGLSLAAAATGLFLLTTPAPHYGVAACDAMSISMLGLATGGGVALCAATLLARGSRAARAFGVAAAGGFAFAVFAGIEPACLRGPFAQIDPAIRPIWLDHVDEVQSLAAVWELSRLRALMAAVHPLLALAMSPLLLLSIPRSLRAPAGALVLALAVAFVMGCMQIRSMDYANLLAVPLFAAIIAVLAGQARRQGGSPLVTASAATVLASSSTLAFLLSAAPQIPAPGELDRLAAAATRAQCLDVRNYQPLAQEPPGLVLSFIEGGPMVLLASEHSVLQAPYHRNAHGMIAAASIWSAPPERAHGMLEAVGVDLVALCPQSPSLERLRREAPDGLAVALARGERPAWLTPLDMKGSPLLAFRVSRTASPP